MHVRALHALLLRKPVRFGAKILMHENLPCSMTCVCYDRSASMLALRQHTILSGPGIPRGPFFLREVSAKCRQGLQRAMPDVMVFQYR